MAKSPSALAKRNCTCSSPTRLKTIGITSVGDQPPVPATAPMGTSSPSASTLTASAPAPLAKKRIVGCAGVTQIGGVTALAPAGMASDCAPPPHGWPPSASVAPSRLQPWSKLGAGVYCARSSQGLNGRLSWPGQACAAGAVRASASSAQPRGTNRGILRRPCPLSNLINAQETLFVFGVDAGDELDVRLEPRAPQFGREQLVDLEDAGGVVHGHLDAHRALLAGDDPDLVDRGGGERVDVGQAGLVDVPRTALLHVERVGHAHHAGLERERAAALAVADDGVQDLADDHGPLGVLVGLLEQLGQQVGGQEQA